MTETCFRFQMERLIRELHHYCITGGRLSGVAVATVSEVPEHLLYCHGIVTQSIGDLSERESDRR